MIRDRAIWAQWETENYRSEPVNLEHNWRLFEAMLDEARKLGVWARNHPLDGIELKLRMARILNATGATGETGTGA